MKRFQIIICIFFLSVTFTGCTQNQPHPLEKTVIQTQKTDKNSNQTWVADDHGPPPDYLMPKVSLNKNVVNLKDSLSVGLYFKVDQDITLDDTRLLFYQNGKQEPTLSIPLTEWSHVSLKRGDVKQKNII